jgi:hypothetical protein
MPGLIFEDQPVRVESKPNRMDIALFAGFVRMKTDVQVTEGSSLYQWLDERGWIRKPYGRSYQQLQDLPVPVESWQEFESLFDWQNRTLGGGDGATYLGAAVRSFFAQGGRKCYVVRVDDPWGLDASSQERLKALDRLIPGYPGPFLPTPQDRYSWKGVGHLYGLPDVSFVCMPDLVEAVANQRIRIELPVLPPSPPEQFVECSVAPLELPSDQTVRDIGAPVCDDTGFANWKTALELVTSAISRSAREVELVAAVPIPVGNLQFHVAPSTAFLQLGYPWVRTPGSDGLPARLESPDGALAGLLARSALSQGTYQSAANVHTADLYDLYPVLDRQEQQDKRLIERVSLFGQTPAGLRLLSDVTMSLDERYRPGSVSRMIATVVRTARRLGEEVMFEASGERLWGAIASRLDGFMRSLYLEGVFAGASPSEAYTVRCDASTMTQNDIDNGRIIALVQFDAAVPVDTITVVLIVNEGIQNPIVQSEAA